MHIKPLIEKGEKSPMPTRLSPMLCTLVKEPFNKQGWVNEVKWDGYRIIAFKNKNNVSLKSRSGIDYSDRYTVVHNAVKKLTGNFVIDGEVVAFDKKGEISFDTVQKANPDAPLAYYVFDIVWYDGRNVMQLPLIERKAILKNVIGENETVKFSDHFSDGIALYKQAEQLGLEGIVTKNASSIYRPGKRGDDWLKVPTAKRQEFVIGGWAESTRGRSFRSLLFGAYNKDKQLEWIGRSGGGYKEKDMPGILKKLKTIEISESPFINKILDAKGAVIHYVKPELVANFKFATWTKSGRIRKPATFLGFRNDKKPETVVREVPLSEREEKKIIEEPAAEKTGSAKIKPSETSNWPELKKIPVTTKDKIEIENCTVELTNIEHHVWPGITKADLITYYNNIAPYLLPYIHNRPLSLHLKPYGATVKGFYIKDMEGNQPGCAEIFSTKRKHPKAGKRNVIDYLVCNNKPTLLYVINLGCIDLNPWSSRIDSYLEPDFIIIDLDPSDDDFKKVIETSLAAKKVFDKLKLTVYPKTSGKTGMHLLIPCKGFTFPEARIIAINIYKKIHELVPEITTDENSTSKRGAKLFIDYTQNDETDTIAAPYSVRPAPVPTVSTPLEWREVNKKLDPTKFTIHTIGDRLQKKGDLFEGVMNEKIRKKNSTLLRKLLRE
jgi:bifunctional non-homologous end joining protein LigD